jgi:hypothetical protein
MVEVGAGDVELVFWWPGQEEFGRFEMCECLFALKTLDTDTGGLALVL